MRKRTVEKDGQTHYLRYYDDWRDFVSFAERVENGNRDGSYFGGMSCSSLKKGKQDWYGTSSLAEAIQMANTGWEHGRQKVRDIRNRLNIDRLLPNAQRIVQEMDVAGDEPDIDLFLSGEPENMATLYEKQLYQHGKVLRFVMNRSDLAYVDGDKVVRRGIAVLTAIETLIRLGYSIELLIAIRYDNGGYAVEQYIPILNAGDPINMDTLAFMLLQPAVLRRLGFASMECEPSDIRRQIGFYVHGGYGGSSEPSFLPDNNLYLKWKEDLLDSDDEIMPLATDILNRVGVSVTKTV